MNARGENGLSPKVALVVDNPRRDLPGIVLVAMELARQGNRVSQVVEMGMGQQNAVHPPAFLLRLGTGWVPLEPGIDVQHLPLGGLDADGCVAEPGDARGCRFRHEIPFPGQPLDRL